MVDQGSNDSTWFRGEQLLATDHLVEHRHLRGRSVDSSAYVDWFGVRTLVHCPSEMAFFLTMIQYHSVRGEMVLRTPVLETSRPPHDSRSAPARFWLPTKMTRLPFLPWRVVALSLKYVVLVEYQKPPKEGVF